MRQLREQISTNPVAYVVTGPTSGIGRQTALTAAAYGTVVLAGRDRIKLQTVQKE